METRSKKMGVRTAEPFSQAQMTEKEHKSNTLRVPMKKKKQLLYKQISNETRAEIVRRVIDQRESVAEVSRDLNIKYTTASSIVEVYRRVGRIDRIPQKQRKRKPKIIKGIKLKKEEEVVKQEFFTKNEESVDSVKLEEGSKCSFEKTMSNQSSVNLDLQQMKFEFAENESKRDLPPQKPQFQGPGTVMPPTMGLRQDFQPIQRTFPSMDWSRQANPLINPMILPFPQNFMQGGLTPAYYPGASHVQNFISRPQAPVFFSTARNQGILNPNSNVGRSIFDPTKKIPEQ